MKSRYLACSVALVALLGAGTEAIAQTASVPARRLFLYDGGTAVTLNRITLESPDAATLTGNYGLILPPAQGNVNDIMYVQSNSGSNNVLNFTNGSPLFWRVVGNDHVVTDGVNNLLGTLTNNPVSVITNNIMRMRITAAGNVGIGTNTTPSELFSVGNAGGQLTVDALGNLVTAGNITVNGTGTNTLGVAASTNNITGTNTLLGVTGINNAGAFATTIGAATNTVSILGGTNTVTGTTNINATGSAVTTIGSVATGGAVNIRSANPNPITIDVAATTNNLVLNNILSNASIEDVVWLTAANQVRRTPFSGLVEQGITFNNEGGTSRIRLGGLANTDNPFLASRFVNLDASNINFTANGGALTPLQIVGGAAPVINVTGTTNINTTVGAITNIGVAAGTNNITGTTTVLGATDVNVTGTALTRLGNATSTVTIQGGTNNVVGTANINSAAAAATNIGFAGGTNTVLGTTNINATGAGTTTIGNTGTGGAVSISASNANPITIDVAATTNNLVLNNILAAPIDADLLWITAGPGNAVRRVSAASTADEGIQFNNGAYRLGHLVNGSNPIVNPRFVRTGPAGTLTFNTDASTSLVINGASGAVSINSVGAATTEIGNASAGTISLNAGGAGNDVTIAANDEITLTSASITTTTTGATTLGAGSTFSATGATGATITATANNLVLNAVAGNLNGTGNQGVNLTATNNNVVLNAAAGNLNGTGNTGVNLTATTNNVTIGATAAEVVLNAGTNVDINATANVTVDGVNITETATTAYALSAPTANINTATASTTNIGNLTNGIVNVAGNGNNGVTITGAQAAPGNNTIVMEVGNVASNLVINNLAVVNPIEDLLWINAANQVRRTPFSGTANEGLMFQTSAYRLGANAIDVNPIVSGRIVTVGAAGTLSFQTAAGANNMLQLNNNGNVAISSVGAGTTAIGHAGAGTISLNAGGAGNDVTIAANDEITLTSASITGTSTGATTLGAGSTFSATGATGATLTATAGNATINATANNVVLNAGTDVDINATANVTIDGVAITNTATGAFTSLGNTATITGATATTINATANALTLNANGAAGSVVINAIGAGNDVDINAADAVTVDATTIALTTVGGDVTITVPGGASGNDLLLVGIDADATPTHMLTHTGTSEVRRTQLSGTADQGLIWDGVVGRYRLGSEVSGTNPVSTARFVTINGGGNLTFNNGAGITMLTMANDGNVGISTAGAGLTNIGSATAGAIAAQSSTSIGLTAPVMTSTSTTSNTINAATLTLNSTAGFNTVVGNATGTFGLTSTQLNINSANGELSDAAGAVTVNDDQGFVVNSGVDADLTITEAGLDRGANQITVGATTGTLLLNGASGTANITAPSLAADVLPAFVHPTDGIVIANGSGVLRRRPVTDLINANQGLTYNEDATANVQMGSVTDGNGAITTNRFVRIGLGGTLTFNTASSQSLVLNNNGNVEINSSGSATTAIGSATAGSVSLNAGGAGNDVTISANDDVSISANDILNSAVVFSVSAATTNINTSTSSTTSIGNNANGIVDLRGFGNNGLTLTGAQASAGNNTIVIDPGVTTSNLVLANIPTEAPVTDLLWINASNQVRRAPFSGTAAEGIQFQSSSYRLGVAASFDATPWNDLSFAENRYVNLNTSSLFFTSNNSNSPLLTLNGNGANGNVSISSYGTGNIALNLPVSGDLVLNGVDTDNSVLTYLGIDGGKRVREVSLNATAWLLGGNSLTGTQTIGSNTAHDVAIETNGTTRLTFSSGGAITQSGGGQVTFSGNVDATNGLDVTNADLTVGGSNFVVNVATGNISNVGTTTFGDGVGTDNATFNLGILGLLRINNDPAVNDLLIQETSISRTGNIAIDPGASSTVTTNGSLSVAGGASLGDGAGTDNVTINTGAGTFSVLGQTNINTSGSNSTTIGSTASGTGVVSILSQNSLFMRTSGSGTVYIQDTDNGNVVIGNAASNIINVVGTVNVNATSSGGVTNIGTGTNASNVTIGNTGNDVIMGAPATFQRSMNVKYNTINATTTLDEAYHVVVCTNPALITVNLPAAGTAGAGRVYVIKSAGAGDVVIDPDGVQTIDGLDTFTITGGGNLTRTIVSDGTTWYIIGN